MSLRDRRAWLADLVAAADLAARVVERVGSPERYAAEVEARAVVERQIEIIAECLRRLLVLEPGLSLIFHEARDVIAMRNVIAHGYHVLQHPRVYTVVVRDLPSLRARTAAMLAESK